MLRKYDAIRMKSQAIPHTIQDDLGIERKINGLIESRPYIIWTENVSAIVCIGNTFPMTMV